MLVLHVDVEHFRLLFIITDMKRCVSLCPLILWVGENGQSQIIEDFFSNLKNTHVAYDHFVVLFKPSRVETQFLFQKQKYHLNLRHHFGSYNPWWVILIFNKKWKWIIWNIHSNNLLNVGIYNHFLYI